MEESAMSVNNSGLPGGKNDPRTRPTAVTRRLTKPWASTITILILLSTMMISQVEAIGDHDDTRTIALIDVQPPEFLPLCDLVFNVISLAAYFCDWVFDGITVHSLYSEGKSTWTTVTLIFIIMSTVVCQILSFGWISHKLSTEKSATSSSGSSSSSRGSRNSHNSMTLLFIHLFQCGVLWRYFKLFIPVDLLSVKEEVRDLCVLRMVHAFCQAAPMLLIQVYLMWNEPSSAHIKDIYLISTFLSLFNLCWALASFSKNVRKRNIHKLVLTWLGVIFQLFWRIGTVSARIVALTLYARWYREWVFIVILLHWFSMLLWLLSPKNLFYGESIKLSKRITYSALIAYIYIFCFINLSESNSRRKMTTFYSVMFAENVLLLLVCFAFPDNKPPFSGASELSPWFQSLAITIVLGGFAVGIFFMLIYYHYFHIKHFKDRFMSASPSPPDYHHSNTCPEHGHLNSSTRYMANGHINSGSNIHPQRISSPNGHSFNHLNSNLCNGNARDVSHRQMNITNGNAIPGVFNCRLNPALKRKKKKPSTFVPPPPPPPASMATSAAAVAGQLNSSLQSNNLSAKVTSVTNITNGSPTDFWSNNRAANRAGMLSAPSGQLNALGLPPKHPFSSSIASSPIAFAEQNLPGFWDPPQVNSANSVNLSSVDVSSIVSSRVNIQQKLQEKKQQQLLQLKEIEEEIKQGKLKPRPLSRIQSPQTVSGAYPPQAKRQPLAASSTPRPLAAACRPGLSHLYYYHPLYKKMKLRSHTPEVLLAPHHLDNSRVYYDYPSSVLQPRYSNLATIRVSEEEEDGASNRGVATFDPIPPSHHMSSSSMTPLTRIIRPLPSRYKRNHEPIVHSDGESQASLPRSYTLPRALGHYRPHATLGTRTRYRSRKQAASHHPGLSTPVSPSNNNSSDGDVDSDDDPPSYAQASRGEDDESRTSGSGQKTSTGSRPKSRFHRPRHRSRQVETPY